jgi:hypothetical protein
VWVRRACLLAVTGVDAPGQIDCGLVNTDRSSAQAAFCNKQRPLVGACRREGALRRPKGPAACQPWWKRKYLHPGTDNGRQAAAVLQG